MKNKNRSFFCLCLSKITWLRFFNAAKVLLSYYFSLLFNHPINWGYPIVISIETSSVCNLKCPECLNGLNQINRTKHFIDLDIYKNIILEVSKKTWIINLYFQGEPLINTDIMEIISFARNKGLMTVISSNGNLISKKTANDLVESGLDFLIISFDGWDQVSYESYRKGGNFDKLISGMKFLADAKRKSKLNKPSLLAQCLITSVSENHLPKIKEIALKNSFEFKTKPIQIYGNTNKNNLLPNNSIQKRYSELNGNIKQLKKQKNHCRRLWTHSVITSDVNLVACCNDKLPNHVFGNLHQTDFKTILKSTQRINFQRLVLQKKSSISICKNCNLS